MGDFGFELACTREGELLRAQVDGHIDTLDALIAMFRGIEAELRMCDSRQVLVVDNTFGVVPGEPGMRQLVAELGGGTLQGRRIAYVDARGTAVGRMELGEIVAREHGHDCRVFGNEHAASIWLRHGVA